jgi:hypothetical protein
LYATHDTFLKQRKVISCNGSWEDLLCFQIIWLYMPFTFIF